MLSEKRPEGPIQDIMTIRLTLVSAPISLRDRYGVFSGAANTEPSFGLVCLAAVAQRAGVEVAIVEAASENLSVEQTIREVLKLEPDVVGITSTTLQNYCHYPQFNKIAFSMIDYNRTTLYLLIITVIVFKNKKPHLSVRSGVSIVRT